MRRSVAIGVALVLLATLAVGAFFLVARAADAAAAGTVAAASRGDVLELETRMRRELTPSDLDELGTQVPLGLFDPILYSTSDWRFTGPFRLSATVTTADDRDYRGVVEMEWDRGDLSWKVLSVQRTD